MEGALEGGDAGIAELQARRLLAATSRNPRRAGSRGRLVRKALLLADLVGLLTAFVVTEAVSRGLRGSLGGEVIKLFIAFVVSLPAWVIAAKIYGLYDRDEERTDHSTTDDIVGVFHLVTVGVWVLFAGAWLTGWTTPQLGKTTSFWFLAIAFITTSRATARALARKRPGYIQNALIVGAGEIGQLIGRKYVLHPEYGIRLVGFADDEPRELRDELSDTRVWTTDDLADLARREHLNRVLFAFSSAPDEKTLELVHELRGLDVQIDIVPRLFEIVPPSVELHSVEGTPLLGLRPARMSRTSRAIKRTIDIAGAATLLVLTSPLFVYIAWRVHRDSEGPIFFRQTRLGENMKEFTALKFRTMAQGEHGDAHREYISTIMSSTATVNEAGLYKPEILPNIVTTVGTWLRRTSLDELPQLLNVLRGDMSLVGPRPCIPYETAFFRPQHFDRFAVPAGITGLWQVTARSRSTFGEALDLDVAYARGWSLALDLRLLLRTPVQILRERGAA